MPDTLAQRVRAKHPGAYDDMSDQALEQAVKAKFPGVYDDLPATTDGPGARPASFREASPVTSAVMDFAQGAGARVMNTVFQGGDAIRRGLGMERVIDRPEVQAGITPPDSVAGKVGGFVSDTAQVLLPMGQVARATQGARLGTRMAAEGAAMGGIAAAQGGDPVTAGVIGAALPAVGAVIGKMPPALRESAQKKVAQALGAQKERFKALAAKRAPEILERGLKGSRESLLADATAQARAAGQAIDEVLTTAGAQRVPTSPVLEALETAKAGFQQVREVPLSEAIKSGLVKTPGATVRGQVVSVPVVLDARPIEQLSRLQQTIRELGDDASVEQLTAVRRVWDDVVARAGGFAHRSGGQFGVPLAEQTEAWAKREATKAIRKTLAEEVPDLARVNAEFAFWKDLKDVLTATQSRTQPQGPGLSRTVGGIVGAATGFGGAGPLGGMGGTIIGGTVTPIVIRAITSPRMRFASAHVRNALADAIESGNTMQMSKAAVQVLAAQGAQAISR